MIYRNLPIPRNLRTKWVASLLLTRYAKILGHRNPIETVITEMELKQRTSGIGASAGPGKRRDGQKLKLAAGKHANTGFAWFGLIPVVSIKIAALNSRRPLIRCSNGTKTPRFVSPT